MKPLLPAKEMQRSERQYKMQTQYSIALPLLILARVHDSALVVMYNVKCEKKKDNMSFHNYLIGSPSELHNVQCVQANTGQMYTQPDNG